MAVESVTRGMVLDVQGTLARFGGDNELFIEMAAIVLEDLPPLFARLRHAVHMGDATQTRMHAHALKGLVSGCGGVRAAQVGQQLETAAQNSDLTRAPKLLAELDKEIDSLVKELSAYVKQ